MSYRFTGITKYYACSVLIGTVRSGWTRLDVPLFIGRCLGAPLDLSQSSRRIERKNKQKIATGRPTVLVR
jgi:hypothetical protein